MFDQIDRLPRSEREFTPDDGDAQRTCRQHRFDMRRHVVGAFAVVASIRHPRARATSTPLRDPEHYQFDFNLSDVAEVWRRGSVISSWLLDLTAAALTKSPALAEFAGHVSDSGEGRWTIKVAIDRRARPWSSPHRSTSASVPVAKPTLQTSFSPPCASNSEATSKSQQSNVQIAGWQFPSQRSARSVAEWIGLFGDEMVDHLNENANRSVIPTEP